MSKIQMICCFILYVTQPGQSGKVDTCDNKETEEIFRLYLYNPLNDKKEHLQLDLDYQTFENVCFKINKILSRHDYFLEIFEQKKNSWFT